MAINNEDVVLNKSAIGYVLYKLDDRIVIEILVDETRTEIVYKNSDFVANKIPELGDKLEVKLSMRIIAHETNLYPDLLTEKERSEAFLEFNKAQEKANQKHRIHIAENLGFVLLNIGMAICFIGIFTKHFWINLIGIPIQFGCPFLIFRAYKK